MTTLLPPPIIRVLVLGMTLLVSTMGNLLVAGQPRADRKQAAPPSANEAEGKKLDLNTATARALGDVSVIGADGAQSIIAARPFTTIDDLNRLKGLSAERLEQIRAKVKVAPETIPAAALEKTKPAAEKVRVGIDSAKVNVNTASYEELAALSSVGPEIAKALVAARPLASLDELSRIREISAERLEQLRMNLTIGDPSSTKRVPIKR